MFAGITYWFPKAFGYKLDPFWGKCSFWFWTIGFYVAFMPLYVLGLKGVTRRLSHFEDGSLQIWFVIAAFGAVLIALGIASFLIQLVVSFMRRDRLRDTTGDPWNGRTLEWSTSSPPPAYNFAFTPIVHEADAWHDMKNRGLRGRWRASFRFTCRRTPARGSCWLPERDLRFSASSGTCGSLQARRSPRSSSRRSSTRSTISAISTHLRRGRCAPKTPAHYSWPAMSIPPPPSRPLTEGDAQPPLLRHRNLSPGATDGARVLALPDER
jgi:hypothetical protein